MGNSERLIALDSFRGTAIAAMIVVNTVSAAEPDVYPALLHAAWNGCTLADLVFPSFLFIVGGAMAFSLAKYQSGAKPIQRAYWHVLRRAAILFLLGVLLNGFWQYDLGTIRILGVLQRISLTYLLAAMMVLHLSRKQQWGVAIAILVGYWLAMMWIPVPGYGAGVLTVDGNLDAYIDRMVIPTAHLYPYDGFHSEGDPEGVLSTLPAVVSVLAGYFTADWIRRQPVRSRTTVILVWVSILCFLISLVWDGVFPINKKLWTSSYVVYTTGWALALLALYYELIEVRRKRGWSKPLEVLGVNAIALFVASVLLITVLVNVGVVSGQKDLTLYDWIDDRFFASWAGNLNGSLLFAIATLLGWWAIAYLCYRQKWLLKI